MTSSSLDADAAKSSIQMLRSVSANAVGYVSWYIVANVRIVAERRNGLQVTPKGSIVNRYVIKSSVIS